MFTYKRVTTNNLKRGNELAVLIDDCKPYEDIYNENEELLKKAGESMWLCYDGDKTVAFAHVSLRHDYVEGTDGGTVGYLEGIYVMPEYRMNGVARELVAVCENWAREKGCTEFASDCEIDNTDSYKFHLKAGFSEANRIICFKKKL